MTYEAWRISYQSAEQAARAAYRRADELAAKLAELQGQAPVAWYVDNEDGGREYNGHPHMSCGRTGTPLFARPIPAEPVNKLLAEALEKRGYTGIESHWSGYRVIIGFATLDAAKQAQVEIVKTRSPSSGQ